ncbi:cross-pathway control WD-repeat protein cpc2 [Mortierella sp. AM989]|nr:cross-pathway control WD-repeat protein cpc2 [Mortierella sp. AM989]
MTTDSLIFRGQLAGHHDWVTAIATIKSDPDKILTSSCDSTIVVWNLSRHENNYGEPCMILIGHDGPVQDIAVSSDGQFAVSASSDSCVYIWDLKTGQNTCTYDHVDDVLSVSISPDDRHIVCGSRDKAVKLLDVRGKAILKYRKDGHSDCVSCVRFSPNPDNPIIASVGWDKIIKIWDLDYERPRTNFIGHTDYISTIAFSPDSSLCASGGCDGITMLWDVNRNKYLYTFLSEGDEIINALVFSPTRPWLCAATSSCIRIWDLESKIVVDEPKPDFFNVDESNLPQAISLAWSTDGQTLFAGYLDGIVRIWSFNT